MTTASPPGFHGPVPRALDGVRVDRVVAMLAGCSRARAARLVATGRVRVGNELVTTPSSGVPAGARLDVEDEADEALRPDPSVAFTVVHADPVLVVVDKPAGLVVHPGAGHRQGTLVAGLLARFPELAALPAAGAGAPDRPGVVHRLDRETSGLLAVARTPEAYHSLVAQLAARRVTRRYLARVHGEVADDRGLVDAPLGRSSRVPTMMTVTSLGRPARTGYRVLAREAGPPPTTLLEVALETGRTHQIRVHLAALGHPVVGDAVYGRPAPGARAPLDRPAGRLLLHAHRLELDHPSDGERRRFESPPPPGLR